MPRHLESIQLSPRRPSCRRQSFATSAASPRPASSIHVRSIRRYEPLQVRATLQSISTRRDGPSDDRSTPSQRDYPHQVRPGHDRRDYPHQLAPERHVTSVEFSRIPRPCDVSRNFASTRAARCDLPTHACSARQVVLARFNPAQCDRHSRVNPRDMPARRAVPHSIMPTPRDVRGPPDATPCDKPRPACPDATPCDKPRPACPVIDSASMQRDYPTALELRRHQCDTPPASSVSATNEFISDPTCATSRPVPSHSDLICVTIETGTRQLDATCEARSLRAVATSPIIARRRDKSVLAGPILAIATCRRISSHGRRRQGN